MMTFLKEGEVAGSCVDSVPEALPKDSPHASIETERLYLEATASAERA